MRLWKPRKPSTKKRAFLSSTGANRFCSAGRFISDGYNENAERGGAINNKKKNDKNGQSSQKVPCPILFVGRVCLATFEDAESCVRALTFVTR